MRTARAFTARDFFPFRLIASGFTLVEILCVISIIALLAALLFPVFGTARAKARQTSCASNLRQIGIAISLYAQDADGTYPLASDTVEPSAYLWTGLLDTTTAQKAAFNASRPLFMTLGPYLKNKDVWRCPSDTGGCDKLPLSTTDMMTVSWEACPNIHEALGTSYFYRAQLGVDGIHYPALAQDNASPPRERGSSDVGILTDGRPEWHGDQTASPAYDGGRRRSNMLFADGHAKATNETEFVRAWLFDLKTP